MKFNHDDIICIWFSLQNLLGLNNVTDEERNIVVRIGQAVRQTTLSQFGQSLSNIGLQQGPYSRKSQTHEESNGLMHHYDNSISFVFFKWYPKFSPQCYLSPSALKNATNSPFRIVLSLHSLIMCHLSVVFRSVHPILTLGMPFSTIGVVFGLHL